MKSATLLLLNSLLMLSCTKDRVCRCTVESNVTTHTSTYPTTYLHSTRSQARANCLSYTNRYNDTIVHVTCKLE